MVPGGRAAAPGVRATFGCTLRGETTFRFGGAKAASFPDSEKISSWD
jgi:hypothetical protein